MNLPMTETFYQWKHFAQVEGEETKRLLTPMSDPDEYEYQFDFMFASPEDAHEALFVHDVTALAMEQNWILCKIQVEPASPVNVWGFINLKLENKDVGVLIEDLGIGESYKEQCKSLQDLIDVLKGKVAEDPEFMTCINDLLGY